MAAAIHAAIFYYSLGKTNSSGAIRIDEWYRLKENVAKNLPSPRILIISGSNGLYGINAKKIEEATGIPTVNCATHGALGRAYILKRFRKVLRQGDIVILNFEYENLFRNDITPVLSNYVLGCDPGYLNTLPLYKKCEWMMSDSFQTTLYRLQFSEKKRGEFIRDIREQVSLDLNDRGDMVANAKSNQTNNKKIQVEALQQSPTIMNPNWDAADQAWIDFSELVSWGKSHGVKVLATYPNTVNFSAYHQSALQKLTDRLQKQYERLGIPTLGTPQDFLFPKEDFFDTIYHLNYEGAIKRTDILLKFLQPELAKARQSRSEAIPPRDTRLRHGPRADAVDDQCR